MARLENNCLDIDHFTLGEIQKQVQRLILEYGEGAEAITHKGDCPWINFQVVTKTEEID